jgi:hypothetical protein
MQDPQWLHVFIDIRADVADVSAKFWSAALGCRVGIPGPTIQSFVALSRPMVMPTCINKWVTTGRAFISTWR